MLAIEPVGEEARPDRHGLRLLGMEVTRRRGWPSLRHVFDLQHEDAALHVDLGPFGDAEAYAVGYTDTFDEILTPL